MDCTKNDFCRSLPPDTRSKLCSVCRRSFLKAGSIQPRSKSPESCGIILDGIVVSTTDLSADVVDHDTNNPALYLGFPGRVTGLEYLFDMPEEADAFSYVDLEYLSDSWVASFTVKDIREIYDEDPAFRYAIGSNMMQTTADALQCMALFRANYTYHGLFHLIRMLTDCRQFLTQQQLANIMNHDRTSISKAVSRIKKEHPELWEAYTENKGRMPSRPSPK